MLGRTGFAALLLSCAWTQAQAQAPTQAQDNAQAQARSGSPWYPVTVVADGRPTLYQPLQRVRKPWRLCALLPHVRDKYWWGVSWGLAQEADRLGVQLGISQAGSYDDLPLQRKQFRDCLAKDVDAILLSAIAADGLDAEIATAASRNIPVIDLVTGVTSNQVTARSLVSYDDMATASARYLLALAGKRPVKVAWLPGPKGAGWVIDAESGMRRAFQDMPVTVLHGGYGPPELTAQMGLLRTLMQSATSQPDYFFGNAVAIEAAANYTRHNRQVGARPIAFYVTGPVLDLIRQGRVLAAASDSPVLQARIAVDLALRILEKEPYHRRVSPVIDMIDATSVTQYDYRRIFAPDNQRILQRTLP